METKVYVHYYKDKDTGIEYRWRTLLKIGDSWKVCGTIFMKNPGSSTFSDTNSSTITNYNILEKLNSFDYGDISYPQEWYEFSIDNTMSYVIKLFESYYDARKESLEGVIQIFNLFNIRDADLNNADNKRKGNIIDTLTYTTDNDIKNIVYPVYIGWGDLWKHRAHRNNAERIFNEVKQNMSYLHSDIQDNKFFHPQYLMNYGKNKVDCIISLVRFKEVDSNSKEFWNINPLILMQRDIKPNGFICKFTKGVLSYEYYCKGTHGYKRQNGIISVGLMFDKSCYKLSVLSMGNHPEKYKNLICDYCENKGWAKSDSEFSFSKDISTNNLIVEFMTSLLQEMKKYRETDTEE